MTPEKPRLSEHDVEKGPAYVEVPLANTAITTSSIITVTESPATPSSSTPPSSPPPSCTPADKVKLQVPASLVGGRPAEPLKVKGWGRFKESLDRADSWKKVSKAESMETLAERTKAHESHMSLKKTDSCDSGITKSDLRLDKVGDFRLTHYDRSPVQPPEGRHTFYPIPEQTLQASLQELKLELKDDMKNLRARMSGLEAQLNEALQLLRKSGAGSPQPLFDISRQASPEEDKEDIFS